MVLSALAACVLRRPSVCDAAWSRGRDRGRVARDGLLDVSEDAVELVETVVAHDELAAPTPAGLYRHAGTELLGQLLLEPPANGESQRYEIIAGERRWRAAQMAGLTEIPAVIRHIPDESAIAVALIENIQRENLNPLEEARALERLVSEFGLTHQETAQAVGRSRAGVSNLLRLLELTAEVCELVEKRTLEMGHARALLALTERRQQTEVALLVARKGLSVRETEALVRRLQTPRGVPAPEVDGTRDPNVARLEQELADKLGARVAIQPSRGGRGKLVVSYNSLDELDGILAHIQ